MLTERDGSFRRLIETVREQQAAPSNKTGRPPKHRVPTTGHFAVRLHDQMKTLARERSSQSDHMISTSDVYNEAAMQLVTDLHSLLGEEFRLPAGAVTMAGILGLRELLDRPILTPLRDLEFQNAEQQRTTLYFDQSVWDALLEMSLRFGLRLRRTVHVHRLIELGAAWFLAGLEISPE